MGDRRARARGLLHAAAALACALAAACGGEVRDSAPVGGDGSPDASTLDDAAGLDQEAAPTADATIDAVGDATHGDGPPNGDVITIDTGTESGLESGPDTGSEAVSETGSEAGSETGSDASSEDGSDANLDGGPDAPQDVDAGCPTSVETDGGIGPLSSTSSDSGACTISLPGPITQVSYDPVGNIAYGIDPTDQMVSTIDLASGNVAYRTMYAVPNAICVSASRSRLYIVETGSTFIDELSMTDLSLLRRIPWPAPSYDPPNQARYQVYCGASRLYVVDSQWAPSLWTVENLDGCPLVVDHTASVSGVGALVLSADESEFYYWYQFGRVAGYAGTSVSRVSTSTWSTIDQTNLPYPADFYRDPLDTPILWDTIRNLIFAKNRVFDSTNLMTVVYSFINSADTLLVGAYQNAYALDQTRGRMVSRHNVFSADTFMSTGTVTDTNAAQYFISSDGMLRALLTSSKELDCQALP